MNAKVQNPQTSALGAHGYGQFFSASVIAAAESTSNKSIHRRARREGWPARRRGNSLQYVPSRGMKVRCQKVLAPRTCLLDSERTLRELKRAAAVCGFVQTFQRRT